MSKLKKSKILLLSILAALLFVTPLIPSSLRPKYLYFISNLLIIALGAEAGLVSYKRHAAVSLTTKPNSDHQANTTDDDQDKEAPPKAKVIEKSASVDHNYNMQKCPSMPSLFFIGGGGDHSTEVVKDVTEEHDDEEEEVGGISGQELFIKAESFIGNFYKQLKMQREESWKRIHGFYHKAF